MCDDLSIECPLDGIVTARASATITKEAAQALCAGQQVPTTVRLTCDRFSGTVYTISVTDMRVETTRRGDIEVTTYGDPHPVYWSVRLEPIYTLHVEGYLHAADGFPQTAAHTRVPRPKKPKPVPPPTVSVVEHHPAPRRVFVIEEDE